MEESKESNHHRIESKESAQKHTDGIILGVRTLFVHSSSSPRLLQILGFIIIWLRYAPSFSKII